MKWRRGERTGAAQGGGGDQVNLTANGDSKGVGRVWKVRYLARRSSTIDPSSRVLLKGDTTRRIRCI